MFHKNPFCPYRFRVTYKYIGIMSLVRIYADGRLFNKNKGIMSVLGPFTANSMQNKHF